jgi:hypothetical protein
MLHHCLFDLTRKPPEMRSEVLVEITLGLVRRAISDLVRQLGFEAQLL